MIPENTYTPLKADCPSAPCSASSCECAKCVGYRRYIDWKKMESKTSTPESRREFEEWITAMPYERDITRIPNDSERYAFPNTYVSYHVDLAWEAWQAARETLNAVKKLSENPVTLIHNGVGIASMYPPGELEKELKSNTCLR